MIQLPFVVFSILFFVTFDAQAQGKFRSLAGAFEVDNSHARNGQGGFSNGIQFRWTVEGAELNISHGDRRALGKAIVNGAFSAEALVDFYYPRFSRRGERVSSTAMEIDGRSGHEIRYKTAEHLFVARVLPINDKIYVLDAAIPLAKIEKLIPVATSFFESFRVIPDDIVSREVADRVARATPKAFAPAPSTAKPFSDVSDQGLKGAPRTMLLETARYGADQALHTRKGTKVEEFDEAGFLLKEIEYDSFGLPNKIYVYGFLGGKRVARISQSLSEGTLLGIAIPMSGKFDDRYEEYYVYRYVGGKLAESRNYFSNKALYARATYRYTKNLRTIEYFDGGTRPYQRTVEEHNTNGLVVKVTPFESFEGGKPDREEPFEIEYEKFDVAGNWTQRTFYRNYGLEGKGKRFAEYTEYRTITYY